MVLGLALEVSESGYSSWKNRKASQHCREDARLAAEIQQIFLNHRCLYGSPRIHAVLKERGIQTSRKRVVRLMRASGFMCTGQAPAQTHDEKRSSRSFCAQSAQARISGE